MSVGGGGRRVGLVVVAALFVPAIALAVAPYDLSTVRLGGVSLLWWYAFALGPALAVLVAALALLRGRL